MKEKLTELIKQAKYCTAEELAEYLISAGLTVQTWIPVTERLPNAHDSCIVYRKGTFGHFSMLYYTPALGFHFYDSEWGDVTVDNVTHWMPLPEPPKEVD